MLDASARRLTHPTTCVSIPLVTASLIEEIIMSADQPLEHVDDWEEVLQARYPQESGVAPRATPQKKKEEFRNYRAEARPSVHEFYRLNHRFQTFDFVQAKRREYLPLVRRRMGIWEAMEFLNTLVDDSDPD